MDGSPSATTLPNLLAMNLVNVELYPFLFVTWPQVTKRLCDFVGEPLTRNHCLFNFDSQNHRGGRDIFFIYYVTSGKHLIKWLFTF